MYDFHLRFLSTQPSLAKTTRVMRNIKFERLYSRRPEYSRPNYKSMRIGGDEVQWIRSWERIFSYQLILGSSKEQDLYDKDEELYQRDGQRKRQKACGGSGRNNAEFKAKSPSSPLPGLSVSLPKVLNSPTIHHTR